jgi:hypothetical protein
MKKIRVLLATLGVLGFLLAAYAARSISQARRSNAVLWCEHEYHRAKTGADTAGIDSLHAPVAEGIRYHLSCRSLQLRGELQ